MVMFATFFYPLGNHLVDKFGGSRPVIALGAVVSLSIVFVTANFRFSPTSFVWTFSFGMGMIKGFLQSSLLRAGWSHLPERKGLVTGCIISGYGFGGFIFGNYAQWLANPNNLEYEEDENGNWYLPSEVGRRVPYMLDMLAWTWLIQIIFGLVMITNYEDQRTHQEAIATDEMRDLNQRLNVSQQPTDPEFMALLDKKEKHDLAEKEIKLSTII